MIKVGIIGCGFISDIYLENSKRFNKLYEIVACSDLNLELAKQKADKFSIPHAYTTNDLLADPAIDLVINLTIPSVHAEVAIAALRSGKHVYSEKPIAINREEGEMVLKVAKEKGLLVGNAPDTLLGGGLQTSRKLIDDGWIGKPVSATAFMMNHGHESWHPSPEFYYKKGGGPLFDMGPYYLTALIFLMGPITRVTGSANITFPERMIISEPKYGEKIHVETPTQINGVLDFESGAVGSIITSFDTWHHHLPRIEIHGTEGSLSVPDPNTFGGPVYVRRHDHLDWMEIPLSHGFTDNSRGIGLADMANAILTGSTPRANGELAQHVLDIMQGILDASEIGQHVEIKSRCSQPKPLHIGINEDNFNELIKL
ncbi:Gfo/Idh/MocA family protein [Oceanobacillus arenosus]|nr:Gfo/Idh/MocA family oxidoreductase [Oceanobacillus arenosus]